MHRQIKNGSLIANFIIIFFAYEILNLLDWFPVKYWGLANSQHFDDVRQVLTWVQDSNSIKDIISNQSNLYGSLLTFILGLFKFPVTSYLIIGHLNIAFVSIGFAYLIKISNLNLKSLFVCSILISPPILLLLERGNIDGIIFCSVLFAYRFLERKNYLKAFTIISLVTLIKYYSVPLLIFFCLNCEIKNGLKNIFRAFTILIVSFIAFEIYFRNIQLPQVGNSQFGFWIWKFYLDKVIASRYDMMGIILSLFLFAFILVWINNFKSFTKKVEMPLQSIQLDSYFFLLLFFCCVITLNYDYRLIYLIPLSFGFYNSVNKDYLQDFKWLICGILWLTYPARGLEPIGDFLLEFYLLLTFRIMIKRYFLKSKKLELKKCI